MRAARALALLLLLPAAVSPSPLRTSPVVFTDITSSAGIVWKQVNGASVRHFLPETMGGGVGFLDFDHDGLLDIFLVTGGETPNNRERSARRSDCAQRALSQSGEWQI